MSIDTYRAVQAVRRVCE